MAKATILCMFSGGLDSTGVLHKLMTEKPFTDLNLIVHHVILQNRENRALAEMGAVEKILGYYQQNMPDRNYTYTQSVFNTEGFAPLRGNRFPFDMDVCAFTASNIAVIRKDIRYIAMGRTKTDIVSGASSDFNQRMERAQTIFKAVYSLEKEPLPQYVFPVKDMTKQDIWNYLPDTVRSASWYCRRPVYQKDKTAKPCEKCPTCKDVQEFISNG